MLVYQQKSLISGSPSIPSTQVWLANLPTTPTDVSHHKGDPLKFLRVYGSLSLQGIGKSLIKGLMEGSKERNNAHRMDALHPSDISLHFQVGQCEQQLDGHLQPCGRGGKEV